MNRQKIVTGLLVVTFLAGSVLGSGVFGVAGQKGASWAAGLTGLGSVAAATGGNDLQQNDLQQKDLQQKDLQQNDLQQNDLQQKDLQQNDLQQTDLQNGAEGPAGPEEMGMQALNGNEAPLPLEEEQILAPGVKYLVKRGLTNLAGEPLSVYLLELDPANEDLELLPVTAGEKLGDTRPVSELAAKYQAVAAVNGGFFASSAGRSLPVGNLMIGGELLAQSDFYRTSLGLRGGQKHRGPNPLEPVFGYFNPATAVRLAGETVKAVGLNSGSTQPGLYIFTPAWGETVAVGQDGAAVVLKKTGETGREAHYLVTQVKLAAQAGATGGEATTIPRDGAVLVLRGSQVELAGRVTTESTVTVSRSWNDEQYWGNLQHLLTAGPLLVEQGEPVFQAVQEGFTGQVLSPNPRTAVGVNKDGKILLVVAERTQPGSRVGLTLEELALLLVELGVEQGMALDGGGSSTMVVGNQVVNGVLVQRSVANALVVLVGPRLYLNNQRIYPDVPPVIKDNRTLVPVRVISETLAATVEWRDETRQVVIAKNGREIVLTIDTNEVLMDEQTVTMDVPAIIVNDRTMVPLRFITEVFAGLVHWDGETRSVYLYAEKG